MTEIEKSKEKRINVHFSGRERKKMIVSDKPLIIYTSCHHEKDRGF